MFGHAEKSSTPVWERINTIATQNIEALKTERRGIASKGTQRLLTTSPHIISVQAVNTSAQKKEEHLKGLIGIYKIINLLANSVGKWNNYEHLNTSLKDLFSEYLQLENNQYNILESENFQSENKSTQSEIKTRPQINGNNLKTEVLAAVKDALGNEDKPLEEQKEAIQNLALRLLSSLLKAQVKNKINAFEPTLKQTDEDDILEEDERKPVQNYEDDANKILKSLNENQFDIDALEEASNKLLSLKPPAEKTSPSSPLVSFHGTADSSNLSLKKHQPAKATSFTNVYSDSDGESVKHLGNGRRHIKRRTTSVRIGAGDFLAFAAGFILVAGFVAANILLAGAPLFAAALLGFVTGLLGGISMLTAKSSDDERMKTLKENPAFNKQSAVKKFFQRHKTKLQLFGLITAFGSLALSSIVMCILGGIVKTATALHALHLSSMPALGAMGGASAAVSVAGIVIVSEAERISNIPPQPRTTDSNARHDKHPATHTTKSANGASHTTCKIISNAELLAKAKANRKALKVAARDARTARAKKRAAARNLVLNPNKQEESGMAARPETIANGSKGTASAHGVFSVQAADTTGRDPYARNRNPVLPANYLNTSDSEAGQNGYRSS